MNKSLLTHFAEALFQIAKEDNKVVDYGNDLSLLEGVFTANPDLVLFLDSPLISRNEKEKILNEAFSNSINKASLGFLKVLTYKGLVKGFPTINESYQHCYHRLMGILEGVIYAPYEISEIELRKIENIFSKRLSQRVTFKVLIDKKVLAGMKIYLEDTLYDYSVDTKLNNIKDRLTYKD